MKLKKLVALTLAATMVLGSTVTVFADGNSTAKTGTVTGTVELEGAVDTSTVTITLPTVPTSGSATNYDYKADPEKLIAKTNAAAYTDSTFEADATVFFNNGTEDGKTAYKSTSKKETIYNDSLRDLKVTISATATNPTEDDKAVLAAKSAIATATDASVYLGLVDDGTVTNEVPQEQGMTTSGTAVTATYVLKAANEGNLAYSYSSTANASGYKYTVKKKDGTTADNFANVSYWLTGASGGSVEKWTKDTKVPGVAVTYTVDFATSSDSNVTTIDAPAAVPDKYTVTYKKNVTGDTTADVTEEVAKNGNPTKTASTGFTRDGYTLSGWNTQADGEGTAFTATSTVTANIDVYAQWTESDAAPDLTDDSTSYTIGDATSVEIGFTYGAGSSKATGFTITFTNSSGTNTLTSGSDYSVSGGKIVIAESQLTAVKNTSAGKRTYTVKFNDIDETSKTFILNR